MAKKTDFLKHNGKDLVPVRIDLHTWVLLPKAKATPEGIAEYKKNMERSRELALRHFYGNN